MKASQPKEEAELNQRVRTPLSYVLHCEALSSRKVSELWYCIQDKQAKPRRQSLAQIPSVQSRIAQLEQAGSKGKQLRATTVKAWVLVIVYTYKEPLNTCNCNLVQHSDLKMLYLQVKKTNSLQAARQPGGGPGGRALPRTGRPRPTPNLQRSQLLRPHA